MIAFGPLWSESRSVGVKPRMCVNTASLDSQNEFLQAIRTRQAASTTCRPARERLGWEDFVPILRRAAAGMRGTAE